MFRQSLRRTCQNVSTFSRIPKFGRFVMVKRTEQKLIFHTKHIVRKLSDEPHKKFERYKNRPSFENMLIEKLYFNICQLREKFKNPSPAVVTDIIVYGAKTVAIGIVGIAYGIYVVSLMLIGLWFLLCCVLVCCELFYDMVFNDRGGRKN